VGHCGIYEIQQAGVRLLFVVQNFFRYVDYLDHNLSFIFFAYFHLQVLNVFWWDFYFIEFIFNLISVLIHELHYAEFWRV
jgi:hypothetical protein